MQKNKKKEDSGFYSEWNEKSLLGKKAPGQTGPQKGIWLLYLASWEGTGSF